MWDLRVSCCAFLGVIAFTLLACGCASNPGGPVGPNMVRAQQSDLDASPVQTDLPSVPAPEELQVKTPNVMLYIRVAGNTDSGNILIVINGGPGSASHDMMGLDPLASETLALVSYDQRGTGRSTAPTNGYALSEYIKDLDAVRQYFGVQKVHLFGHSWGGLVALAYAAAHQENVASVSLLGSLGPTYGGWLAAQVRFAQKVAKLQARGFIPKPIPSGLAGLGAIMPAYFSDPRFPIPAGVIKGGKDLEVQKATWQAIGKWDLTNDFGKIATSVLVLWGEEDPLASATYNKSQYQQKA
jgi:pimeloyl-ACP methyl ester carboxylesterase